MSELRRPYPGLRAFRRSESDLFFGREDCVNDMVDQLGKHRFLAVLGPSGSGKSSLVRTGMLGGLYLGFLATAGSRWVIADFNPGENPMRQLACGLLKAVSPKAASEAEIDTLAAVLRKGPRSVVKWVAAGNTPPGTNLLLLVDQFEELFRYGSPESEEQTAALNEVEAPEEEPEAAPAADKAEESREAKQRRIAYTAREEAEHFVAMLLESAASKKVTIYIVITMRSEFLGACASFDNLAETISNGLYLAPRMGRDECRRAIEGPAAVLDFEVQPLLVNTLVNDLFQPWVGEEGGDLAAQLARQADQLPLMQHVLNRLWAKTEAGEPGGMKILTLDGYKALGGLKGALDAHGDEVKASLSAAAQAKMETVFRALVTGDSVATAVRNRVSMGTLVELAGGARQEVQDIVAAYRAEGCNFLRTSGENLDDDKVMVDVTHESLIRQWTPLREWLEKEIRDDAAWRRLIVDEDNDRQAANANPLSGLNFERVEEWWAISGPTAAWAAFHGGRYQEVWEFLERSRKAEKKKIEDARRARARERLAQRQERVRQRWERRRLLVGIAALSACLIVAVAEGLRARHSAAREEKLRKSLQASIVENNLKSGVIEKNRELTSQMQEATRVSQAKQETQEFEMAATDLQSSNSRRALMHLDLAYKNSKDSLATADQEQLARRFATALLKTKGQIGYLGGVEGHQAAVVSSWFSPDGNLAFTRGDDRTVKVWQRAKTKVWQWAKKPRYTFGPAASDVMAAKTSEDGRLLVVTTKAGVGTVYGVATGKTMAVFNPEDGGAMYDASFNEAGTRLATASTDGIVRVWAIDGPFPKKGDKPLQPLSELKSPEAKTAVIYRVAFSSDASSKTLIAIEDTPSGEENPTKKGLARVWNYETGEPGRTLQFESGFITNILRDEHGDFLLAGENEAVIWTPATGAHYLLQDDKGNTPKGIRAIAFSRNGKYVAIAGEKDAEIWDATSASRPLVLKGLSELENDLSFSSDGKLLVTAGDGAAKVWDVASGNLQATLDAPGKINDAEFDPKDSSRLVTASDDETALLWNLNQVFRPIDIIDHTKAVRQVALNRQDTLAVTAGEDGDAKLYDLVHHRLLQRFSQSKGLRVAEFSPDGRRVVTGGKSQSAEVWDVATGKRLAGPLKHTDMVYAAHFSPDGHCLVTLGEDHIAKIWQVDERDNVTQYAQFTTPGLKHIYDAQFSPDSKWLVFASEENEAAVWSISTKETRFKVKHDNWVLSAKFDSTGGQILTGSADGTAKVWDAKTGRALFSLQCPTPVNYASFSPDDKSIVTAGTGGTVDLWADLPGRDSRGIVLKRPSQVLSSRGESIYWAGFNSDSTMVAAASAGGRIRVWNATDKELVLSLDEAPSTNAVIFAHKDPHVLAVAGEDARASFWRVPSNAKSLDTLDEEAKALLPDEATLEQWRRESPALNMAASDQTRPGVSAAATARVEQSSSGSLSSRTSAPDATLSSKGKAKFMKKQPVAPGSPADSSFKEKRRVPEP